MMQRTLHAWSSNTQPNHFQSRLKTSYLLTYEKQGNQFTQGADLLLSLPPTIQKGAKGQLTVQKRNTLYAILKRRPRRATSTPARAFPNPKPRRRPRLPPSPSIAPNPPPWETPSAQRRQAEGCSFSGGSILSEARSVFALPSHSPRLHTTVRTRRASVNNRMQGGYAIAISGAGTTFIS